MRLIHSSSFPSGTALSCENNDATQPLLRVSVVVPVYDEDGNLDTLFQELHKALGEQPWEWEVIAVDDGSVDHSWSRLHALAEHYGKHVRVVRLRRNFGQSAALQAGLDRIRGDIAVLLDADLQNDPADIPRLVNKLLEKELDLVVGWRRKRKDATLTRVLPSRAANALIGWCTGVRLHDYGCTLKAIRASVAKDMRLYGQMHRFIPAWVARVTSPARIAEIPVNHRPRIHGESKYGLSRTGLVLLDLVAAWFFLRYSTRPGHLFGAIGLVCGFSGATVLGYLTALKLMGQDIGSRPALLAGVLLVVAGVQLLTTGVLAELLVRVYHRSHGDESHYAVRAESTSGASSSWQRGKL